jgi:tRNA (guanosine-2'-O-)-methyltransferase
MTPRRQARIKAVLDHRQNDLAVVLENVFDPHNVSAVLRSCDAVGVQEVYVLNSRIPPHLKLGHRSSGTAAAWMTILPYADTGSCMVDLKKKFGRIISAKLSPGTPSLFELDLTTPVALVFGNERDGVSQEADSFTDGSFMIPQVGMTQSLNISVACAVTLYEVYRQRSQAGHYLQRKLSALQYEKLMEKWSMEKDRQS